MMQKLELYIHIPFCVQKCAYCDFLSAPANDATKAEYVDALKKEIQRYREVASSYQVSSVFVGGGTPSILSCEQMGEIFKMLRQVFTIDRDAEITIEANPGTVTEEKLEGWKQAGINRISFGLQSVNNEELKMLGRIHTYEEFRESYDMARQAGFDNINIDLISAIPGQTVKSWEHTLRTVAELHPEHISAYSLIIEEGTRFYQWYGKGQTDQEKYPPLPDEDAERQMYERTEGILEEYGFHRYEISNYAREGKECRHNLGYWSRVEYLGIGLGASSFISNTRYHLCTDMISYIERIGSGEDLREEIEVLTKEDAMEEFMFLGLRKMQGISRIQFENCFGNTIEEIYGDVIEKLEQEKMLEVKEDKIRLTKRGIDVSNYVFCEFLL